MAEKKPVKSQRYSVSKNKLAKTANSMEQLAVEAAVAGEKHAMRGAERLDAAGELSAVGNVLTAQGASDITRAVDAKIVSDRLGVISEAVGVAGVVDIAEGAAILAQSDDVGVLSALVGMMSEDDLKHGLELARLSGELRTAGDIISELKMPVVAKFLADRADLLHEMSIKQIHVAVSTQGVSQLLDTTGARIGELGENEVMEGAMRLDIAEAGLEKAESMSKASDKLAEKGMEEIMVAGEVQQLAREEALEGAKEIATGSMVVGEALALDEVANNLKEKSE